MAGYRVFDAIRKTKPQTEPAMRESALLHNHQYANWVIHKGGHKLPSPQDRLQAYQKSMSTAQRIIEPLANGVGAGVTSLVKSGYGLANAVIGQPINPRIVDRFDNAIGAGKALGQTAEHISGTTTAADIVTRTAPALAGPYGILASAALSGGETSADSQRIQQRKGMSPADASVHSRFPALAAAWTDLALAAIPVPAARQPVAAWSKNAVQQVWPAALNAVAQVTKPLAETVATDAAQSAIAQLPASRPSYPATVARR